MIVINKYFFEEEDEGLYPVEVILTDDKSKLKGFNRFSINIAKVLPRSERVDNRELVIYRAPNAERAPVFTSLKASSNGVYAKNIATEIWI